LTATGALSLLRDVAPRFASLFDAHYDFGGRGATSGGSARPVNAGGRTAARPGPWRAGAGPSSAWHNPLAKPLPPAPGVTLYCLHGTGLPTDRAYVLTGARDYAPPPPPPQTPTTRGRAAGTTRAGNAAGTSGGRYQDSLPFEVDETANDAASGLHRGVRGGGRGGAPGRRIQEKGRLCTRARAPVSGRAVIGLRWVRVLWGWLGGGGSKLTDLFYWATLVQVRLVDGDGTITNLALALPCAKIWTDPTFNPGGAKVGVVGGLPLKQSLSISAYYSNLSSMARAPAPRPPLLPLLLFRWCCGSTSTAT
jgi:hypothetical protein